MNIPEGSVLQGHRILELLGKGGYGAVYKALDLSLERLVAFKILHTADPNVEARLRDEARLLARINDPHVVQIFQIGQLENGQIFLSMELFGTGSLSELIQAGHRVETGSAVRIIAQVLKALSAAHEVSIVHRDIKEANILLDLQSQRVKVCDFGIARAREPMEAEAPPTGPAVLGTPHYIAPERFRGERDDPRSDLYSVGVVLYRLLTGQRPFEVPGNDALTIVRRQVTEVPPEPDTAPKDLRRYCKRLLSPDPSGRPPDAHSALKELLRAWQAEPETTLEEPLQLPAPQAQSSRVWISLSSLLLLLILGIWLSLGDFKGTSDGGQLQELDRSETFGELSLIEPLRDAALLKPVEDSAQMRPTKDVSLRDSSSEKSPVQPPKEKRIKIQSKRGSIQRPSAPNSTPRSEERQPRNKP